MLPNFLVIGAQKCGTSWLHRHLRQHPDIFMPEKKELEYFSYSSHLTDVGIGGYEKAFSDDDGEAWVGEATASYFWGPGTPSLWGAQLPGFNPKIPEAIADALGDDTRLIVSLRDPVERAVSAYLHHIAHGAIDPRVPLLQAGAELGIVSMGFYGAHLEHFYRHFKADQVLVLIMERDIVADPESGLSNVATHLNVEPFIDRNLRKPVFPGRPRRRVDGGIEARFPDDSWQTVADDDALSVLRIAFGQDLMRLEERLEVDLTRWWPLARGSE